MIRQRPGYLEFCLSAFLCAVLLGYAAYESILPDTNLALCGLLAAIAFFFAGIAALALLETRIHADRSTNTLVVQRRFLSLSSKRRIVLSHIRDVMVEPALFHRAGLCASLQSGRRIPLTYPPVPGDRFWLTKLSLDLSSFVPKSVATPIHPQAG